MLNGNMILSSTSLNVGEGDTKEMSTSKAILLITFTKTHHYQGTISNQVNFICMA